jgi:hypothetical protein
MGQHQTSRLNQISKRSIYKRQFFHPIFIVDGLGWSIWILHGRAANTIIYIGDPAFGDKTLIARAAGYYTFKKVRLDLPLMLTWLCLKPDTTKSQCHQSVQRHA